MPDLAENLTPAQSLENGRAAALVRVSAINPHSAACHARAKSTGRPCTLPAMRGQAVCQLHGGKAPAALAKAAARLAERQAVKILEYEGRPEPVDHPVEALMQLAGEVVKVKDILSMHVAKLTQIRYESDGGEQLRGEIQAYERALDRSVHVLTQLAKLGLEERQQKLRENQARIVTSLFIAVFADPELNMSPQQQEQAKLTASRHLRIVAEKPRSNSGS